MTATFAGTSWPTTDFYAARAQRRRLILALGALAVAAAYATLVVATGGSILLLVPLGGALVLGAIIARPVAGIYFLACSATLFEQFDLPKNTPLTAQTHVYQNLIAFTPIPLRFSVIDLLMLVTLVVWAARTIASRTRPRVGPFAWPVGLYLAAFVVGTAIGVARGGFDENAALSEVRAPVYVAILYFLTADLIRTRAQVAVLLWSFALLVGVKALQGIGTYLTSAGYLDEVTGHEDVVFFNVCLALALVASILGLRTRLTLALWLLTPVVMTAELFTQRRAGFVGMGIILVATALLFLIRDTRRGLLLVGVGALCMGAYLPLFWDNDGAIGQPIRAVRAALGDPDVSVRDQLSDEYRVLEDHNIAFTMKQVPITGVGVGQAYFIDLQPPRLPASFTYWQYITHNALLWLWLKAGPLGAFALWFLVSRALLVIGGLWRRLADPELQLFATVPLAFVLGQVIFSSVELGLTYSRTMILFGTALGMTAFLVAARRAEATAPEPAR